MITRGLHDGPAAVGDRGSCTNSTTPAIASEAATCTTATTAGSAQKPISGSASVASTVVMLATDCADRSMPPM